MTSSKLTADLIYQFVKAVFDNFDEFRKLHPVLGAFNPAMMGKNGLTAPIHDGAYAITRPRAG